MSTPKVWPDSTDLANLVREAEKMGKRAPAEQDCDSTQAALKHNLAGVVAFGRATLARRQWHQPCVPPADLMLTGSELRDIVRKLGRWPNEPPCGTRVYVVTR